MNRKKDPDGQEKEGSGIGATRVGFILAQPAGADMRDWGGKRRRSTSTHQMQRKEKKGSGGKPVRDEM